MEHYGLFSKYEVYRYFDKYHHTLVRQSWESSEEFESRTSKYYFRPVCEQEAAAVRYLLSKRLLTRSSRIADYWLYKYGYETYALKLRRDVDGKNN